jgi:hypothetical protein
MSRQSIELAGSLDQLIRADWPMQTPSHASGPRLTEDGNQEIGIVSELVVEPALSLAVTVTVAENASGAVNATSRPLHEDALAPSAVHDTLAPASVSIGTTTSSPAAGYSMLGAPRMSGGGACAGTLAANASPCAAGAAASPRESAQTIGTYIAANLPLPPIRAAYRQVLPKTLILARFFQRARRR